MFKEIDPKSPFPKWGLHRMISFPTGQHRPGERRGNFIVKRPKRHYLSQIKVNINSNTSSRRPVVMVVDDRLGANDP